MSGDRSSESPVPESREGRKQERAVACPLDRLTSGPPGSSLSSLEELSSRVGLKRPGPTGVALSAGGIIRLQLCHGWIQGVLKEARAQVSRRG